MSDEPKLESPVFILGLHRSGTTLLYQMLAQSECFNIVTARHVVCFGDIACSPNGHDGTWERVRGRFQRLGLLRRDVDAVEIHPDTPEEYGFLLDNLHAGRTITRRHFGVFRHICETVQREQPPPRRALLLKNPWDFGNAARIRSLIPDARFVYIHRNPLHALSSMLRMIVSAIDRPSVYLAQLSDRYRTFIAGEFPLRLARTVCRSSPGLILQCIVLHAARQATRYLQQRSGLPRAIDIRFDSLCRRPNETIAAVLGFLRLQGSPHDYRSMIGPHRSSLAPEILSHREFIVRRLGAYAAAVGYDLPRLFDELPDPTVAPPGGDENGVRRI